MTQRTSNEFTIVIAQHFSTDVAGTELIENLGKNADEFFPTKPYNQAYSIHITVKTNDRSNRRYTSLWNICTVRYSRHSSITVPWLDHLGNDFWSSSLLFEKSYLGLASILQTKQMKRKRKEREREREKKQQISQNCIGQTHSKK